jgi:hypothetical protein
MVQHIGHPRNATKPTGKNTKLNGPITEAKPMAAANDPNPITPRNMCCGSERLAKLRP